MTAVPVTPPCYVMKAPLLQCDVRVPGGMKSVVEAPPSPLPPDNRLDCVRLLDSRGSRESSASRELEPGLTTNGRLDCRMVGSLGPSSMVGSLGPSSMVGSLGPSSMGSLGVEQGPASSLRRYWLGGNVGTRTWTVRVPATGIGCVL